MMVAGRILTLLLAVGTLQVVPALCLAGWLEHYCPANCGEHSHPAGLPDPGSPLPGQGCSHENACSHDPCRLLSTQFRSDTASTTELIPTLVALPVPVTVVADTPVDAPRYCYATTRRDRTPQPRLDDLPLLI